MLLASTHPPIQIIILGSRVLLVPLVEGLLGLLHGLVDTKEVLVAEGVDGLGLVQLLCGAPAVLEPDAQHLSSNYQLSDSAEEHCHCPTLHHTQHCDNRHRLPRLALPIELGRILARSASISSSKGGIGVSEYFGITLKISLTMSASQQA